MSKITVEFKDKKIDSYGIGHYAWENKGEPFKVEENIGRALIEEGVFKLVDPEKDAPKPLKKLEPQSEAENKAAEKAAPAPKTVKPDVPDEGGKTNNSDKKE